MNNTKPYTAAIAYSLIIGFSFLFVKIALTVSNPFDVMAHRFTAAFIFALIVTAFTKKLQKIHWKDFLKILPLAIFYPTLFFLFQILGLQYIAISEAGILQAMIPIFTIILAALLLKVRTSNLKKFFIVLSVLGVSYIFLMNGVNVEAYNWTGIILMLLSTLSLAFYTIFARNITRQYPLFTLTFYMTLVGFVSFNVLAIGYHLINGSMNSFFTPLLSIEFVGSILYLGVMASFMTSFLSNYALNHIDAANMSVFNNASIVINILAGVIFLNESIYYYHIIGAVVIIAGVFGTNYTRKTKRSVAEKVS